MNSTLYAAIMAIALLLGSVFPAKAETPTPAAIAHMISVETSDTGVSKSDIARIVKAVFAEAKKHSIDPLLMLSLINTESKFRSWAKNNSGARGLTQVIPRWHRDKIKGRNIMHIETNIEVGAQVLADCLDRNNGYIKKALRCYSGGARNYQAKLMSGRAELQKAEVLYRFQKELPFPAASDSHEPGKPSLVYEPLRSALPPKTAPMLREEEVLQLLAIN